MVLFSYGSPSTQKFEPGWTLRKRDKIDYDYNVAIKKTKPRAELALSTLRYAENRGLVTLDTAGKLVESRLGREDVIFHNGSARCIASGVFFIDYRPQNLTGSFNRTVPKLGAYNNFNPIFINNIPKREVMKTLIGEKKFLLHHEN